MNDRERNILDMFVKTREFDRMNAGDYASLPDAEANFAIVRTAIEGLENFAADQTSGESGQAVERKSAIRAAMRRKMKRIARTARALNIDDPGFHRLFRIPDDNGDQKLIAAAREFVEEITAHQADFERLGITAALVGDLNADIDALEAATNLKAQADITGVGATAGIDEQIDNGMDAETFLDAIMKNVYADNPIKLAEWMTARHVKRAPRRSEAPTP